MPSYYILFHLLTGAQDSYAPTEETRVVQDLNCLKGWKFNPHSNKCILLVSANKNLQESRAACKALAKGNDGDLASSPNKQTQNFLKSEFELTGLTRLGAVKIDGLWRWLDGTPWHYKQWGPSRPNGEGNSMGMMGGDAAHWNDCNEDRRTSFFCQSGKYLSIYI